MGAPGDSGVPDAAAQGAAAARDTLVELLSIVTHDLNNPLQSLIVLLELCLDDAPVGSDVRTRIEQCQVAGERIKTLTAALGGLLRGRREDGPGVWTRIQALLGRRFERTGVAIRSVDVSALADVALPSGFFFALCAACLVVLGTAAKGGLRGWDLAVRGDLDDARAAHLELALVPAEGEPASAVPTWDLAAAARLRGLAHGDAAISVALSPGVIRLDAQREDGVA